MSLSENIIISKAREITGNKVGRAAGEQFTPDEAVQISLKSVYRDLNKLVGTIAGSKEVQFRTESGKQDYDIDQVIGADVYRITRVTRSDAYVPDNLFTGDINPSTGMPTMRNSIINPGLQGSVFQTILGQQRASAMSGISHRVVDKATGGKHLRLMPPPPGNTLVVVEYVTTRHGINTLPDDCESALIYAACIALLNGMINRLNSDLLKFNQTDPARASSTGERIDALLGQRDYYQTQFDQEIRSLQD